MRTRLLQRLLITIFFIAISALSISVSAQINLKIGSGKNHQSSPSSSVTTAHVQAQLVAHAPHGVAPGQPLWLGLLIDHQPDWHTYWKNPGDSGLPTQLEWQLPPGLQAGDIAWPLPRKIPIGDLANYGYEGQLLLPVPITVTPRFAPDPLARDITITLDAFWLVCRQECVPEEGRFTLQLPIQGTTALHAQAFEAAAQAQPQPLAAHADDQAQITTDANLGLQLHLHLHQLPSQLQGQTLELFVETPEVIETAAPLQQQWQGGQWQASLPLSAQRSASPAPLPIVIAHNGQGWRLELPVPEGWPQAQTIAPISGALQRALDDNAKNQASTPPAQPATPPTANYSAAPWGLWLAALGGALLGGLILNLMPCVFPVLAIKVLGFAQHAQNRRAHRISGLAYTAGVLLSFVLLGAAMLGLRAAGEAVGWGFQLQSPAVVAGLALLFTLIGLNLMGLFEVTQLLPSSLASLQARHPVADAFLTGVLAVAVASPCTAPFMGASLGLTATLAAWQALGIFAALGLGLALPYLLASWLPAFARALPRPGAWMQTLRQVLAFPMFATVVWLLWVLGQQSGIDGAAALLAMLVALSMVVWSLSLHGSSRVWIASFSIAISACLAWIWGEKILETPDATYASSTAPNNLHNTAGIPTGIAGQTWQAWQPEQVAQLLQQGRPVFVDYTAAWCVTCQYNKKTTLSSRALLQDFAQKNVALLRADWTRRDPSITAALQQLGRSGVPVYVLHAPGKEPVVFGEILSEAVVRDAVRGL